MMLTFRYLNLQAFWILLLNLVVGFSTSAYAQSNEHVQFYDVNKSPDEFVTKLSPRSLVKFKQRIRFPGSSAMTGWEV